MTFFELINGSRETETKSIIKYKTDGNGVYKAKKQLINLARLYDDNSISGIYADGSAIENGVIIYKDFDPCIEVSTIYNDTESERLQKSFQSYNNRMRTFEDLKSCVENIINENGFIKNDVLYLLELHGENFLYQNALQTKQRIKEERQRVEQIRREQDAEEEWKQKEETQRQKENIRLEKISFLKGYGVDKTQIQIERLYNILSKGNYYLIDDKSEYMNRRDFVIKILDDGGYTERKENVVKSYGSKWNPKESKPKTEYRLYTKGSSYYIISKTEYDFANYIESKKVCRAEA